MRLWRVLFILFLELVLLTSSAFAQQRAVPQDRRQIQFSYAPLVERGAPAVVNIYTSKLVQQNQRLGGLFNDPFFRRFFGENFLPTLPRERIENSLGSGVIVSDQGMIVTNHHVVKGADQIRIVLSDRREFPARLVLSDKRTDLAILQITQKNLSLPYLTLDDSDQVQVGDLVLAIGNPFGVGQTVTSGIVSGLARTTVGIADFNFFIQTDAAINPGNSGGALIGMNGQLIGVNTAIYSRNQGGSIGIGFAIPANMVRTVIEAAEQGGQIQRPWLGLTSQSVTAEMAISLELERPTGVIIQQVHPASPAYEVGIRKGDIITTLNDHEIVDSESLRFRLATLRVGSRVMVTLLRNGRRLSVPVKLIAPPDKPPRNLTDIRGTNPFSGAQIGNLSPAYTESLGLDSNLTGVIIIEIKRGSTAHRLGMKPGDIIVSVNEKRIELVHNLETALRRPTQKWVIRIRRGERIMVFRAQI